MSTSGAGRGRYRFLVVAAVLGGASACDSTTAPRPDFDGSRYPYVVSTTGVRLFGTSRVLVIPARFADGAPAPITSAELQAQLFGGPDGGPIAAAFSHASGGAFTLRGRTAEWVTTSVTTADLFAVPAPGAQSGVERYANEALSLADRDIDYGLYDNEGPDGFPNSGDDDGIVDGGVAIVNSDRNRYCNGGTGRGPHPFAILDYRTGGARYQTTDARSGGGVIEVDGLTLMAATHCSERNAGSPTLAHEYGHLLLGLPDLYHIVGGQGEVWAVRRWVSGCWELMAAGSWGCGSGPPDLDYRVITLGAWSRSVLGWASVTTADPTRDMTYDLDPLGRGGDVLRVPIKPDEYLLIEYREKTPQVDGKLPASGVLVFHVAESLPVYTQGLNSPYRVSLIEADDDSTLLRTELQGGNRGTPTDAFGVGGSALRPGVHTRARGVDGTPFPFAISSITIDAAAHRARLRIAPVGVALSASHPGLAR